MISRQIWPGSTPVADKMLVDLFDQVALLELPGREVDAHAQLGSEAIAPGPGSTARLLEHEAAERQDEAGLLGQAR